MASEIYTSPEFSLTKNVFEGMEVREYALDTLQELLYEPKEEVESIRDYSVPSTETARTITGVPVPEEQVEKTNLGFSKDNWCLDDLETNNVPNTNWIDMASEMPAWYGEIYMEEIGGLLDMDYSLSHTATVSDEFGYICLWGEN